MILDLQKANMWKRISAALFDSILLSVLAVALALALSALLGYDGYSQTLNGCYEKYEEAYSVELGITQEEYLALSEADKALHDEAAAALSADPEAVHAYNMVISLTLMILSMSILGAYLVLEFILPVLLGHGRTLGKRIFSLALMRTDGVKVNTVMVFTRSILGKYTVETMVPLLVITMILWGSIGIVGAAIVIVLAVGQLASLFFTRTNSAIHDHLACTVVVDMESQMIFDTAEDLIEYKKKLHAESVSSQVY